MEKQFETDDLTLASYLRVEGVPMVRAYRDHHKVIFVFSNEGDRAAKKADEFYDSAEGKRAHDLVRQYRLIRGLALDIREGVKA